MLSAARVHGSCSSSCSRPSSGKDPRCPQTTLHHHGQLPQSAAVECAVSPVVSQLRRARVETSMPASPLVSFTPQVPLVNDKY
jgi:hypothetical protein